MKYKIVIFLFFFNCIYLKTVAGCCASGYLTIYPNTTLVSSNTAFLIEFQEGYFKVKDIIPKLLFTAINQKGISYNLLILETNFSGSDGQILLKSKQNININDTISIKVSFLNTDTLNEELTSFQNIVNMKKWIVVYKKDNQKPKWINDTTKYTTDDSRQSSAPGYSVIIYPKTNEKTKQFRNNKDISELSLQMYYKVFFNNQEFICPAINGSFYISYSICGSNFSFDLNKDYIANLQAIDASGNYSKKLKLVKFKTTTKEEQPIMIDY
ncbi:MAG TPA: hypothetical protein PK431_16115 [Chitinophagales bacterium]|nr:hypothetical protein [Chitinophagales bacterium]